MLMSEVYTVGAGRQMLSLLEHNIAQSDRPMYCMSALEKGLVAPIIIPVFKQITIVLGGAKHRMQRWCSCKTVSGGACFACVEKSPGIKITAASLCRNVPLVTKLGLG